MVGGGGASIWLEGALRRSCRGRFDLVGGDASTWLEGSFLRGWRGQFHDLEGALRPRWWVGVGREGGGGCRSGWRGSFDVVEGGRFDVVGGALRRG